MQLETTLSPEHRAFRESVRAFVREHVEPLDANELEWADDPADRVPWQVFDAAAADGLHALTAPTEFGGRDANLLEVCIAAEELAVGDLGVALSLDQRWKVARIVDASADPEVRERFFEAYVDDPRHVLASASTEPANGSNNVLPYEEGRYDTVAERDGDEWVVHGEKVYITNGEEAKTLVVRAQTDPDVPHHDGGATAFLVPGDADGITVTERHEKASQRTINNATLEFDGVRVPDRNVLGEVGDGMRVVGGELRGGHVETAALALGVARAAYEAAFEYASEREQGGRPIVEHQAVGHDLADMATKLEGTRSLVWAAAEAVEDGDDATVDRLSSMAKLQAAEVSVDVCERAVETFGGAGIMLDHPVQKYYRDAMSFPHSDGTQQVFRQKLLDSLVADGVE